MRTQTPGLVLCWGFRADSPRQEAAGKLRSHPPPSLLHPVRYLSPTHPTPPNGDVEEGDVLSEVTTRWA